MLTIEQLKARKDGIGGSDAAAILGISKWKTPLDIYFDKTNEEIIENNLTPQLEWGNKFEPLIVEKFEEVTGKKVNLKKETFKHKDYPFMLANLDGHIEEENALIECKTVNAFAAREWGEEGSDNLPEPYLIQCAHYCEVMNISKVYVPVLIGGQDFRIYDYNHQPELGKILIEKEKDFWYNHVLPKIPPQPINEEDAVKLWSHSKSISKTAPSDIAQKISDLHHLKNLIKNYNKDYQELSTDILLFMQEAEELNSEDGRTIASWKTQKTNRFNLDQFKKQHPEIYKKYLNQSSSRVFRLKGSQ